jgi:TPR repeat protein
MYEFGQHVKKNLEKAFELYKKSAKGNVLAVHMKLGDFF